jgi:hypothetical protein
MWMSSCYYVCIGEGVLVLLLCVCMYVCVYVCASVCVCRRRCPRTTTMCVYVCVCPHTTTYAHTCVLILLCMHSCMSSYTTMYACFFFRHTAAKGGTGVWRQIWDKCGEGAK